MYATHVQGCTATAEYQKGDVVEGLPLPSVLAVLWYASRLGIPRLTERANARLERDMGAGTAAALISPAAALGLAAVRARAEQLTIEAFQLASANLDLHSLPLPSFEAVLRGAKCGPHAAAVAARIRHVDAAGRLDRETYARLAALFPSTAAGPWMPPTSTSVSGRALPSDALPVADALALLRAAQRLSDAAAAGPAGLAGDCVVRAGLDGLAAGFDKVPLEELASLSPAMLTDVLMRCLDTH